MNVILEVNLCELPDEDDPDYETILRECIIDAVNNGSFEILESE